MVKILFDLLIYNTNIITMDSKNEDAEMLGVKGDIISYVGKHKSEYLTIALEVLDLEGKFLLPGFIDLHTHLWKESGSISINLGETRSYEEAIEVLRAEVASKKPGEWIFARNWDETKWKDRKEFLDPQDLDKISPKNPLYTHREDGHLCVANSLAMKGVLQRNQLDKHPGIVKDSLGQPTGILKDVWIDLTPYYKELIPDSIETSLNFAASKGITTAVDNLTIMPSGQQNIMNAYFKLDFTGKLPIRIFLNPTRELMEEFTKIGLSQNWGSSKLRFSCFKGFYDGALGAHTALLSSPYKDKGGYGDKFLDDDELISQIIFAEKNEITLCIHAIGDQAIENLLSCFEKGINETKKDFSTRHHRIEHAEMITNEQIIKARKLGILLSMQPNFLKWEYPGELYEIRLGKERFMSLNRFSVIQKKGIMLNFGSDNMPLSPLSGIREATTFPSTEVKIPIIDALRAYTINNAKALFIDSKLGSITEGKYADFVVLTHSPLKISPSQLNDGLVEKTFVGGKKVFDSNP